MQHMPFKRLLSAALSVVLLLGLCASAVPVRAVEPSKTPVTLTESRTGQTIEFFEEDSAALAEGESHSLTLTVAERGEYRLSVCYRALPGRQVNPEASFALTGEGVSLKQSVKFARRWLDLRTGDRFEKDSGGNEVLPKSFEESVWQQAVYGLSAEQGSAAVELEAGEYTLTISMSAESVELGDIRLLSDTVQSYETYLASVGSEDSSNAEPIRLETELISAKSDSSIIATYDRSSPTISPNYPDVIALNIVGGSSFAEQGQWIEWEFDVAQGGLYTVDVRYQQDSLRELGVGRKIYLDGTIPFAEFENYLFPYGNSYETMTLADSEGTPYRLYLTQGTHTLRMEVSQTHLEHAIIQLRTYIEECNSMYRRIISITGANPDIYRDYYLDKELPELMPFLEESLTRLTALAEEIEQCSEDGEGSETSVIYETIRTMENFIDKPYKIPATLSEFKNRIDALADLILTLETQALTLDYITFAPATDVAPEEEGFFARIWSAIKSFFQYIAFRFEAFLDSFSGDEKTTSGDGERTIRVWINMGDILVSGSASGRDQMQIIRQLADDSFTGEHNISVEFSLVSAGDTLSQAILAGKGPDVALFVNEQTVVNLGIRGVLADMTQMDGYDDLASQVYPSSLVPFEFDGGVYAMPETQTFNMMFVRDDIFEELGLEVPNTWDEFYAVQKKLAEKKLEIGIPEGQGIFEMLLMQRGGSIYNEDCTASGLKSQESVEAFTQWTDLYLKHSLPLSFSFVNRFRTGEMPMGIMTYTTYNQLCVAAPEIKGQWSMYPVPATVREDGTLDRTQSSTNTGCIVMSGSEELDAAYEFVQWWIDSETQTEFGRQVESVLGKSARYNTANAVTFEELNWTNSELETLREARKDVSDVPQTMVTYYVSRCVTNAFRRVVYSYEKPRDVIYRYSDDLDLEFERKREVMEGHEE